MHMILLVPIWLMAGLMAWIAFVTLGLRFAATPDGEASLGTRLLRRLTTLPGSRTPDEGPPGT